MPTYEASAVSAGTPDAAWSVWTDVAAWSRFDHVDSASIDGPFEPGATIRSKARGFPNSTLMRFDHLIEPTAEGTRLTERVEITGPLARIAGPLMRGKLERLFADSVAAVTRASEQLQQ